MGEDSVKKILDRVADKKNDWYLILGVKDEVYYSSRLANPI